MSKYFNRIKQQATELVTRSNTLTVLPQELQQNQSKITTITKNKNDLIDKMKLLTYENQTLSLTGNKNGQPLFHISNTWQILIDSYKSMNYVTTNENSYQTIEYVTRCNDSIKRCGEYQLEFADEIKRQYITPNSEFLKGSVKEYKTYSEKLNHCRLDLDSEKAKLAKATDPYKKEKHNDNIALYQRKFDEYSYVTKRLMEPLCDSNEMSEREKSDISIFCRLLREYYEKCLNELNNLDRELHYRDVPKYQTQNLPRIDELFSEVRSRSASTGSLELSPSHSRAPSPPSLPSRPAPKLPQCRAMYNFDGVQEGDLSFKKGDLITLIKSEGSWWKGTLGGKSGDFPSNYVQML